MNFQNILNGLFYLISDELNITDFFFLTFVKSFIKFFESIL